MPRRPELDSFLYDLLHQYDEHVHLSGAYDKHARYSQPSLNNEILPMFTTRWATGPGRSFPEIFPKIKPALQLASRLLMEHYPLTWFSHLTFGERRAHRFGTFLAVNPYSLTADAVSKVRKNIGGVGKVVTFMFAPPGYESVEWGSTTPFSSSREFFHEFRNSDWPSHNRSQDKGHACPCIVINAKFRRFFLHRYETASQDEIYRAWLMLAITLVHEFVHAYWLWLSADGNEPRWCDEDVEAELGWSFEHRVIGYGLNTYRIDGDIQSKFRQLYQIQVLEYVSETERDRIFAKLAGSNRTDHRWTKCNAAGQKSRLRVMDGNEFRNDVHHCSYQVRHPTADRFLAAIQTVPMAWVVDWFREDVWTYRKQGWESLGYYMRPSLGNAFMIIYERIANRAGTMRPLNPAIKIDKEIIDQRSQGDYSR